MGQRFEGFSCLGLYFTPDDVLNQEKRYALLCIEVAFTFDAYIGIDYVNRITFTDGRHRALRLACTAGNALFRYFHCHVFFLLS
jgi:hypothetical protein